jgi:putative SOS response-associated peptidase YedK
MCNEYACELPIDRLSEAFSQTRLPPFAWAEGRIPNDVDPKPSIRIRDTAPIVRLRNGGLVGEVATWAWLAPRGKPVFNFVSEGRDFTESDRVLIPATGFFEFM